MFKENSLVERPPTALHLEQRLCLEAIAFCMRSVGAAFANIDSICRQIKPQISLTSEDRQKLYSSCWTTVDQLHMLSTLLSFINRNAGAQDDSASAMFIKKYQTSTMIRNDMDHLREKIPNIVKSKKRQSTIFGTLSFFLYPEITPEGKENNNAGYIITIPFGSILPNHRYPAVNPAGRRCIIGASLYQFSALDRRLDFSDLDIDLSNLRDHLEDMMEKSIEYAIDNSKSPELTGEMFREQPPGGLIFSLRFTFSG